MSGPTRQRSFRDRLHGIGLAWQSKRADTFAGKASQAFSVSSKVSLDCHGYVNPLELVPDGKKGDDGSRRGASEGKPPGRAKPPDALEYVVKAEDTLAGIAARFECTPGELAVLNRLTTRLIFPGQSLYVPVQPSPATPSAPAAPVEGERFLKVNARHITDGQGVVSGMLLVTPNKVMFVPNVSDPLVVEHGCEAYEVSAPMEFVVAAALYYDIAHMRVRHRDARNTDAKAEVFCLPPLADASRKQEGSANPEESPREAGRESVDESGPRAAPPESRCDESPRGDPPRPESPVAERCAELAGAEPPRAERLAEETVPASEGPGVQLDGAGGPSAADAPPPAAAGAEGPGGSSGGPANASSEPPLSGPEEGATWLKNMVEEKPELFAALEKLVPRPAQASDAPLLYLCVRMGKPREGRRDRRLRPQYWFGIPRPRVEELYRFLEKWAPSVYGDVEEADPAARNLDPLEESDSEDGSPPATAPRAASPGVARASGGALRFLRFFEGSTEPLPPDWEVATDRGTPAASAPAAPEELPLPEMLEPSEILTEDHRRQLCRHLPARAESYAWAPLYSSLRDGFSLKTLYREMGKYDGPVLLAVLDTQGTVFGACASCAPRVSDHFYGTGESFLFTFYPHFRAYHWTGENAYFIKGNGDSLAFGAGDGQFGLWLDGDLFHGRSRRCKTFRNEVLSQKEDFVVKALEAWGFV